MKSTPKTTSTTSKPVELKVIKYPKGFRFGNGDDIIVSSEILHEYIQKQVLEGRNRYRVLPPTVCPECGIKSGQMKRHLVKDHAYRYSEDSPNMPVKALQTNNKETE